MGACWKTFLSAIRRLDMFPSGQLLRYKGQPCYRSLTGGLISIVIIAVFVGLFASTALETINKEIIFSSQKIQKQINPVETKITFSPSDDGFMFSFALTGGGAAAGLVNLSDENKRYFDVELRHWQMQPDYSYASRSIPLVSCTKEHYSQSNETLQYYHEYLTPMMLCPTMDETASIASNRMSRKYAYLQVAVKKCNQSTNSICASEQELQELEASSGGKIQVMLMLSSNVISPQSQNYRTSFLDSRNFLGFTLNSGIEADVYMEQTIIKTDHSLTPIEQFVEQKVLMVEDYIITRPISTASSNTYLSIRINKSPLQHTYYRHFQKIDKFLSYVGGIIGTIIGFLFILQFYSRQAYSISIASQLYLSEEGNKISSKAFHFGYFLLIPFKRLLNLCSSFQWPATDLYTKCMDEANQQLDVLTLMKKISFMQKAIGLLFTKHQLQSLYLFQRENIDEAQTRRKKHNIEYRLDHGVASGNKVVPDQSPVQLNSESNGSHINDVIAYPHKIDTNQQISRMSFSHADPLSRKRLQGYLSTLMKESQQGNSLSSQIVKNISPQLLAKIGLNYDEQQLEQIDQEPSCELQSNKSRQLDHKLTIMSGLESKGKGPKVYSFKRRSEQVRLPQRKQR